MIDMKENVDSNINGNSYSFHRLFSCTFLVKMKKNACSIMLFFEYCIEVYTNKHCINF